MYTIHIKERPFMVYQFDSPYEAVKFALYWDFEFEIEY